MREEHAKIYRFFTLIARLRKPGGCSASHFTESYNINERTFGRYIATLRDLGFEITAKAGRYRIANCRVEHKHEDIIHFTIEEASIIKEALTTAKRDSPVYRELMSKLFGLTALPEIADDLRVGNVNRNINKIRTAIADKRQIELRDYFSPHSDTVKNRLIEPVAFTQFFRYLTAYEPEADEVKRFKTDRIGEVKISADHWQFEQRHKSISQDLFGMSGSEPIQIEIELSNRAYRLLKEEFNPKEKAFTPTENGFLYLDKVFAWEGIGRFLMGLLDEVHILKPLELKQYIHDKLETGKEKNFLE